MSQTDVQHLHFFSENTMTATVESIVREVVGLAKPIVDTGCRLIESLLGEPCTAASEMAVDQIRSWQWSNRIRIANLAQRHLDEKGIAAKVVPKSFLLPLLEGAGNVEDTDLQELWARLLASGVESNASQHPRLLQALKQLSKSDAMLFTIVAKSRTKFERDGRLPQEMSGFPFDASQLRTTRDIELPSPFCDINFDSDQARKSLSNLTSLDLIVITPLHHRADRGEVTNVVVHLSDLGEMFASSCLATDGLTFSSTELWHHWADVESAAQHAKSGAAQANESLRRFKTDSVLRFE